MRQYKVQITDKALADMEEIYNYIAIQLQVPENAAGRYNRVAEAVEGLRVLPERARLMESEPERAMGLRRMAAGNYSVFCVIEGEKVVVARVLYSAMDIEKRLCVK